MEGQDPVRDLQGRTVRSGSARRLRFVAPGRWPGLVLRLDRWRVAAGALVEQDLEAGRGFGWLVVALGCGAVAYLGLPREPSLLAVLALATVLAVTSWIARRRGAPARMLLVATALACGMATAKVSADLSIAPRLDHERTVTVSGWIAASEQSARGMRRLELIVARMEARGLDAADVPRRIAVSVRGTAVDLAIGNPVRMLARLRPPDGPAIPGGYDFARRAFFDGRGASGFALGKASPAAIGAPPWSLRIFGPVADLRTGIADRIRAALPGTTGAIAAALIVGEERAIPESANEALRIAGLYHIISISGLHMSLVAGIALFALRFGLALLPSFALRHDTRKIAAVVALLVTTFYLLLSGGAVATVRSWIMITIALVAVLLDRPAITMRSVAVAAGLILVFDPATVVEPGFLMSFMAVIALVALYEDWPARGRPNGGIAHRAITAGWSWIIVAALTSLAAGLATLPIVVDQFHRAAPYGLVANLVVLPIVGLLIMPFAVVAVLAMPFGLDAWALVPMGIGIEAMMAAAEAIAAWPGGTGLVGRIHPFAMPMALAGFLWLALWRTRLRWIGLAPMLAAFAIAGHIDRPAIVIADDGRTVAVRGDDGRLRILGARDNSFAVRIWLAADADARAATSKGIDAGWRCDPLGCVFTSEVPATAALEASTTTGDRKASTASPPGSGPSRAVATSRTPALDLYDTRPPESAPNGQPHARPPGRPSIAWVKDPLAFEEDCHRADILVTPLVAPDWCRRMTHVFDRGRLASTGTAEIAIDAGAYRLTTALPRFARPWTPSRPVADRVDADQDDAFVMRALSGIPQQAPGRAEASGAPFPDTVSPDGEEPGPRTAQESSEP